MTRGLKRGRKTRSIKPELKAAQIQIQHANKDVEPPMVLRLFYDDALMAESCSPLITIVLAPITEIGMVEEGKLPYLCIHLRTGKDEPHWSRCLFYRIDHAAAFTKKSQRRWNGDHDIRQDVIDGITLALPIALGNLFTGTPLVVSAVEVHHFTSLNDLRTEATDS